MSLAPHVLLVDLDTVPLQELLIALTDGSTLHLTISAAYIASMALLRNVVYVTARLNVRRGSLLAPTAAVYV